MEAGAITWMVKAGERACCGSWIDEGRYYIFEARVKAEIGRRTIFGAEQSGLPSKIYTMPIVGGNPEPLLQEERIEANPDLSPDGQTVVFGR